MGTLEIPTKIALVAMMRKLVRALLRARGADGSTARAFLPSRGSGVYTSRMSANETAAEKKVPPSRPGKPLREPRPR